MSVLVIIAHENPKKNNKIVLACVQIVTANTTKKKVVKKNLHRLHIDCDEIAVLCVAAVQRFRQRNSHCEPANEWCWWWWCHHEPTDVSVHKDNAKSEVGVFFSHHILNLVFSLQLKYSNIASQTSNLSRALRQMKMCYVLCACMSHSCHRSAQIHDYRLYRSHRPRRKCPTTTICLSHTVAAQPLWCINDARALQNASQNEWWDLNTNGH